jgi:cell division protein FtsB
MNTIIFYSSIGVLALVVMAKIPGIEHFVKPIIQILFDALKFIAAHIGSWVLWVTKSVLRAHTWFLKNLIYPPEALDQTIAVKEKE